MGNLHHSSSINLDHTSTINLLENLNHSSSINHDHAHNKSYGKSWSYTHTQQ
jgi:hypothetical protein